MCLYVCTIKYRNKIICVTKMRTLYEVCQNILLFHFTFTKRKKNIISRLGGTRGGMSYLCLNGLNKLRKQNMR